MLHNSVLLYFNPISGGGMFNPPPPPTVNHPYDPQNGLQTPQNHCEKNKKIVFAYQIGHIEIGKVTKFWGVWRPF